MIFSNPSLKFYTTNGVLSSKNLKIIRKGWAMVMQAAMPAFRRLRQEDHDFEGSLAR
jgi:triphosphoribosyl-dephospho-CoA synthetase